MAPDFNVFSEKKISLKGRFVFVVEGREDFWFFPINDVVRTITSVFRNTGNVFISFGRCENTLSYIVRLQN